MTKFARRLLRQKYLDADFGITGGNFMIAETGTVVICTNEGNGRLSTGLPDVHIAIVGIEKIVPTWADYATLVQTLPRAATGQRMTVYCNMFNGPAREEGDGPRHFYLILVDNGRSDIYASEYTEALACIRCGACLNTCPVYQSVGGHAYGTVYPGPIGSIITPLLMGKENASPLPFASSLCGACKAACPVDINIPDMLLQAAPGPGSRTGPDLEARYEGLVLRQPAPAAVPGRGEGRGVSDQSLHGSHRSGSPGDAAAAAGWLDGLPRFPALRRGKLPRLVACESGAIVVDCPLDESAACSITAFSAPRPNSTFCAVRC